MNDGETLIDYIIVIQARTGSSRLPKKMLLPFFEGQTILDILINRLIDLGLQDKIVVATSTNSADDDIMNIALAHNVNYFRGDETNVTKRFYDCGKRFKKNILIRICADNPLFDVSKIINLIENYKEGLDYLGYKVNGIPSILTHLGFYPELTTTNALEKILFQTNDLKYLEHVTKYIYEEPGLFYVKWIQVDYEDLKNCRARFTVDTLEDFTLMQKVYSEICRYNIEINAEKIADFIKLKPDILYEMQNQILRNSK